MATGITHPTSPPAAADTLKNWIMVVLTLIFISLYGAALIGWLKPLADEKMVLRLEPIIFVIIGYYFGRLPAQQNEKTLKDEIGRQTQKAAPRSTRRSKRCNHERRWKKKSKT